MRDDEMRVPMKIAVIVSDATAMMHTGADMEREVCVFEMPEKMAEYIRLCGAGSYTTISLALVKELKP